MLNLASVIAKLENTIIFQDSSAGARIISLFIYFDRQNTCSSCGIHQLGQLSEPWIIFVHTLYNTNTSLSPSFFLQSHTLAFFNKEDTIFSRLCGWSRKLSGGKVCPWLASKRHQITVAVLCHFLSQSQDHVETSPSWTCFDSHSCVLVFFVPSVYGSLLWVFIGWRSRFVYNLASMSYSPVIYGFINPWCHLLLRFFSLQVTSFCWELLE